MPPETKIRIGSYELLDRIGDGPQGIVFKATYVGEATLNLQPGQLVALKKLREQAGQGQDALRRQRQADILRALSHPNIVKYLDCFVWHPGEWDESVCLVMEFLEGQDLKQLLDASPRGLPFEQVVKFFEQCIEALIYAHACHVVHRDLKPSNLFVTKSGILKLIDFGIARRQDATTTSTASIKGTLDYVAPDFLTIPAFAGDEQSDIFSFGVCLYQALTGQLPFPPLGDNPLMGFMHRWTSQEGLAITYPGRVFKPLVHAATLINKCLSPQRESRYATFADVLQDFRKMRRRVIGHANGERYELVEHLAGGGFGEVYKAKRQSDGRMVAVKQLREAVHFARFVREARLLQAAPHPNLVGYLDFLEVATETDQRQLYLILEFLEGMPGSSLSGRIRKQKGALDLSETLTLFISYLRGLGHLHERGIVHRDIKPSNLYAPNARLAEGKLFDLGIARQIRGGTSTIGGPAPGTPEYMAPELGKSGYRGSPQSDLYSIGLCLYEALTGKPVHLRGVSDHDAWRMFYNRAQSATDEPLNFNYPVFEAVGLLRECITKCLKQNPKQRYTSAQELISVLERIRAGIVVGRAPFYLDLVATDSLGPIFRGRCVLDASAVVARRIESALPDHVLASRWTVLQKCQHASLARYVDYSVVSVDGKQHVYLIAEDDETFGKETLASRCALGLNLQSEAALADLMEIFSRCAEALDYLHAHGVAVHTIEPGMVYAPAARPWAAKLWDWGLHYLSQPLPPASPSVVAPDASGQLSPPIGHADVHRLACMLRDVIHHSGIRERGHGHSRRPYEGEVLNRCPALATLLRRATSLNQEDWPDAEAFQDALRQVCADLLQPTVLHTPATRPGLTGQTLVRPITALSTLRAPTSPVPVPTEAADGAAQLPPLRWWQVHRRLLLALAAALMILPFVGLYFGPDVWLDWELRRLKAEFTERCAAPDYLRRLDHARQRVWARMALAPYTEKWLVWSNQLASLGRQAPGDLTTAFWTAYTNRQVNEAAAALSGFREAITFPALVQQDHKLFRPQLLAMEFAHALLSVHPPPAAMTSDNLKAWEAFTASSLDVGNSSKWRDLDARTKQDLVATHLSWVRERMDALLTRKAIPYKVLVALPQTCPTLYGLARPTVDAHWAAEFRTLLLSAANAQDLISRLGEFAARRDTLGDELAAELHSLCVRKGQELGDAIVRQGSSSYLRSPTQEGALAFAELQGLSQELQSVCGTNLAWHLGQLTKARENSDRLRASAARALDNLAAATPRTTVAQVEAALADAAAWHKNYAFLLPSPQISNRWQTIIKSISADLQNILTQTDPLTNRLERLTSISPLLTSAAARSLIAPADLTKLQEEHTRQHGIFVLRLDNQSGAPVNFSCHNENWGVTSHMAVGHSTNLPVPVALQPRDLQLRFERTDRGFEPKLHVLTAIGGGGAIQTVSPFRPRPVALTVRMPPVSAEEPPVEISYRLAGAETWTPAASYNLQLLPGDYEFVFSRPDYLDQRRRETVMTGADRHEIELTAFLPTESKQRLDHVREAGKTRGWQGLDTEFLAPPPTLLWPPHSNAYVEARNAWWAARKQDVEEALKRAETEVAAFRAYLYQVERPATDGHRYLHSREALPRMTLRLDEVPVPLLAQMNGVLPRYSRLQAWARAATRDLSKQATRHDLAAQLEQLAQNDCHQAPQEAELCLFEAALLRNPFGKMPKTTNPSLPEVWRWRAHADYAVFDSASRGLDELKEYVQRGGIPNAADISLACCSALWRLNNYLAGPLETVTNAPHSPVRELWERTRASVTHTVAALEQIIAQADDAAATESATYLTAPESITNTALICRILAEAPPYQQTRFARLMAQRYRRVTLPPHVERSVAHRYDTLLSMLEGPAP